MRQHRFALIASLIIALPVSALAFGDKKDEEINTNPLTATMRWQPSSVEAGGTAEAFIDIKLDEGFHAYVDKLKLAVVSHDDFKVGELKASPIVTFVDKSSGKEKTGLEKAGQVRALVELPANLAVGSIDTKLKFTYQACKAELCLFPKSIELSAPLTVIANAPNPAGVALLRRGFADESIGAAGLLAGALLPTLVAVAAFAALP